MKDLKCVRCDREMRFLTHEQIQLGKTGWILGDIPNLIAGAIEVSIYICPACQKLEFYARQEPTDNELPQKTCPNCGTIHDFDFPKCTKCKHDYNKKG